MVRDTWVIGVLGWSRKEFLLSLEVWDGRRKRVGDGGRGRRRGREGRGEEEKMGGTERRQGEEKTEGDEDRGKERED